MLRVLDLFSGIGGFSLGLERTGGFRTVAFCEIEPYCQAVLRKHWPGVPIFADIRRIDHGPWYEPINVVCGGFPCQPHSSAARGRLLGTDDDRWLWPEMLRVVRAHRPRWFIGENVTQLDGVALEQVVSDLESSGYEVAPPFEIPACAVGCDHWRPRLWIIGHAYRDGESRLSIDAEVAGLSRPSDDAGGVGAPHGLSGRMDRRRMAALGNAVVPQVVEVIGRAILEAEGVTPTRPAEQK